MSRTSGFDLILGTLPPAAEMTSLVTMFEGWNPFPGKIPLETGVSGEPEGEITVPLDWWIHVGGLLRDRYEDSVMRLAAKQTHRLVFDLRMRPDPVLEFETKDYLSKLPKGFSYRLQTSPRQRNEWAKRIPGDWSATEESASDFGQILGIPDSDRESFVREMTTAGVDTEEPPWIFWSRFPAWKKGEMTALKERLAFLQSLLSPQDERSEAKSIEPGRLMMNPTFEFVSDSLKAFARTEDRFLIRELTVLEAAVLDQVRESFRALRTEAVGVVSHEGRVRPEFVQAAIELLCEDGLLLQAPESFSGQLS